MRLMISRTFIALVHEMRFQLEQSDRSGILIIGSPAIPASFLLLVHHLRVHHPYFEAIERYSVLEPQPRSPPQSPPANPQTPKNAPPNTKIGLMRSQ